jgi:hypothetical protein
VIDGHWLLSNKFDPRSLALYERHYSARHYADGRRRIQFAPPGETMVLLTVCCRALFVWVKNKVERFDGQRGINCAVFRNEGAGLSSDLIREAEPSSPGDAGRASGTSPTSRTRACAQRTLVIAF